MCYEGIRITEELSESVQRGLPAELLPLRALLRLAGVGRALDGGPSAPEVLGGGEVVR